MRGFHSGQNSFHSFPEQLVSGGTIGYPYVDKALERPLVEVCKGRLFKDSGPFTNRDNPGVQAYRNVDMIWVLLCASISPLSQQIRGVIKIQSNFNGSNTFGTMKICSRQG